VSGRYPKSNCPSHSSSVIKSVGHGGVWSFDFCFSHLGALFRLGGLVFPSFVKNIHSSDE
jgi:hypothetical protein